MAEEGKGDIIIPKERQAAFAENQALANTTKRGGTEEYRESLLRGQRTPKKDIGRR
ncbi:hypothetical protein KKG52_02855 [Patescibacteria group bacterium]|nr:hypothetical protein [Patescibacteria group bacterium]